MLRTPVDSSNIRSVGYDESTLTWECEFHPRPPDKNRSGPVYRYYGVPPQVHQAFMQAPSKGDYHGRNIKGVYPYERVSG